MRVKRSGIHVVAGILAAVAATSEAAESRQMLAEAERIVSQYKTVMEHPPGKVPSRDVVDGPLFGNGSLGAVISGPPEFQQYWISKNNFWRLKDGHRQGGPRLFAGLDISIPALKGGTYRIEQDMFSAITTSTFGKDGTNVTLRSFVPATDDIVIVEIIAGDKPVEGGCVLWPAKGRGSTETSNATDSVFMVTKAFTNDVVIPTMAAGAMKIVGR